MSEIRFTVPAVPVAQPRPKATVLNGHARVYGAPKSHPVHAFKATCRMAFEKADKPPCYADELNYERASKPMAVEFTFVMPRPKLPKKLGTHRLPHTKRPDFDNLEKAAVDALTGLAWADDSQLCEVTTRKVIAAADESPHVEIVIRPLAP